MREAIGRAGALLATHVLKLVVPTPLQQHLIVHLEHRGHVRAVIARTRAPELADDTFTIVLARLRYVRWREGPVPRLRRLGIVHHPCDRRQSDAEEAPEVTAAAERPSCPVNFSRDGAWRPVGRGVRLYRLDDVGGRRAGGGDTR